MSEVSFKNGFAGKGWLKRQWPWWVAGLLTGSAEWINYLFVPFGHPHHKFIGVTTGMSRMFANVETTLFGHSLIATRADYQPSIQYIIIGALTMALVMGWLEGDLKTWARYPKAMLVSTAFGAFFFAWGTRVSGGCTLHHMFGGFGAMNLKSWVVITFSAIGATTGFFILRTLRLTQYFKSQETSWFAAQAKEYKWADGLTVGDGKPGNGWLRIFLYAFMLVVAIVVLYSAFAGNTYALKMGWAKSFDKTMIAHAMLTRNLGNIIILLIIGALLGTALAKTGIGTECGLMCPELGIQAERGERKGGRFLRMPYSIRTVFLSYQPFAALSLHIFLTGLVMFLGFTFFGAMEGHEWATKAFAENYAAATGIHFHYTGMAIRTMTTWPMDMFGGFLLGLGTFLMIGCEFRNYGRGGLLYITGLLIWPFFYLGYLPYTQARGFWDYMMGHYPYTPTTFFPALVAPNSKTIEVLIYAAYLLFWALAFVWAVRRGARNIGVRPSQLLRMNSEDMYLARFEKLKGEGKLGELMEIERELYDTARKDEVPEERRGLAPERKGELGELMGIEQELYNSARKAGAQ